MDESHSSTGGCNRPAEAGVPRLGDPAEEALNQSTKRGAPGLALILSAQFVIMLDASIVTVALPRIQRELGFSASGVQAVVTAYNTA